MVKRLLYRTKWHMAKYIEMPFAVHIDLELTSRCNLRCTFCPQSKRVKGFPLGDMDYNLAVNTIIDAGKNGAKSIKFNWRGEPTLYQSLPKLIWFAKSQGFVDTMINTNGNFNEELLYKLKDAGLDTIIFSIDSLQSAYEQIRKGGNMETAVNNALQAKSMRIKNVKVNARICRENLNDDWNFFKYFWTQKGIDCVIKGATERKERQELSGERKNCHMPDRRMLIDFQGFVYPCCADWYGLAAIGNIHENTLKEIWEGIPMTNLKDELRNGMAFEFEPCKSCFSKESYK